MSEEFSPPKEILIEIRGIYDGWSVRKLADGTLVNRWLESDRRYKPTQEWIDRMQAEYKVPPHEI